MKSLLKKYAQRAGYVLGIAVAAIVVGVSLQFAKAWTEPLQSAPNGNVGAPITTGSAGQLKLGKLEVGDANNNDYVPSENNWNYTLQLNSQNTSSIGFHDAYQNVGSIRFKDNLFTIGADDGWGTASTYFPRDIQIGASQTIFANGRMHISGDEILYLLNKDGVNISNAWGGNGNLSVDGNVGIGTTGLDSKLGVVGSGGVVNNGGYVAHIGGVDGSTDPARYMIGFSHGATNLINGNVRAGIGMMVTPGGAGNLIFESGNPGAQAERMRINGDGNVGIGTTGPQAKLHITAENDSTNAFRISNVSNPDNYYLNMKPVVTSGVQRWVFDQKNNGVDYPNVMAFDRGNIGIGTADPQVKLDIKGDVMIGDTDKVQKYDVSGDGKITSSDAVLIMQVAIGLKTCPVGFDCDVNNDGLANIVDAYTVLYAVSGAFDSNLEIGGSVTARSVKFADGSKQITALEGNVPIEMCLPPKVAGGLCEDNFYLKGPATCCPFNSTVAAIAGSWYPIDQVAINYGQNDPDGNWSAVQDKSFAPAKTVAAVRVSGSSNDGGYCYAYWGTGNLATQRHDGYYGYYNMDNTWYEGCGPDGDCVPCPTYPATFDNNGTAKVCQLSWNAGAMSPVTKAGLSIPAGTSIHLQGSHVIGDKTDSINCKLEVQYVD